MIQVLLLEDDDISRQFMADALQALDLQVHGVGSFAQAVALCRAQLFDLIICDMHLSDGQLLAEYRQLPATTPILAVSAELGLPARQALAAVDIMHALAKPMSIAQLHEAVFSMLPGLRESAECALWNHTKSERTLGHNSAALAHLKQMFADELDAMHSQITQAFAQQDTQTIHHHLHKLRASSGFLGADRLLEACTQLDAKPNDENLAVFVRVLLATRAAM